jgi:hypothetical protein
VFCALDLWNRSAVQIVHFNLYSSVICGTALRFKNPVEKNYVKRINNKNKPGGVLRILGKCYDLFVGVPLFNIKKI